MFVRVNGMCFAHCMKQPASLFVLQPMPLSDGAARAKITASEAKPAIGRAAKVRASVHPRAHVCVCVCFSAYVLPNGRPDSNY